MLKKLTILILCIGLIYGAGRAYYAITGGFTLGNMSTELEFDPRWEVAAISPNEQSEINKILNQSYTYLGKGCQAYVFASADGHYVIKFIKYQRFRPQAWINLFTFIPFVEKYQEKKIEEKQGRLDQLYISWKIASEQFKGDTGVVYAHLNKGGNWPQNFDVVDKMGFHHEVDLNQTAFLLQKRATMLCPSIDKIMVDVEPDQAKVLIDNLLAMLLLEYGSGYADNDHALMQNTGVLDGHPIHIDVGQFIRNDSVRTPKIYKQEIFDKTYDFNVWLAKNHPLLSDHLKARLVAILGPDYYYSAPYVHKGDLAKIPNM